MAKNERAKYTAVFNLTVEIPIYAASLEEARHKADRMEDASGMIICQLAETDGDAAVDNVMCTDIWEDVRTN